MKKYLLLLMATLAICLTACKKDGLTVNEEKIFVEVGFVPSSTIINSGWQLTLQPNEVADILPSGDIIYRGTYQIGGNRIKVKAEGTVYDFEIISAVELKELKYGTILKLQTK